MEKYTPIIGMEVHVELKTKSKMFCSCKNDPDLIEPNQNICPICLGHPGTLPVPNEQAIIWTALLGKALDCKIRSLSKFDRKHYFYPDLPKAYQISQYDEPIAEDGKITLDLKLEDALREEAVIEIERVHLEEDTAKLTHDNEGNTLIDFNRAGVPLVEIVTRPNFTSATEAKVYCKELRDLLRYLKISDADMEKGHMRCEANVSVQNTGSFEIVGSEVKPLAGTTLNNKVELKNLNSFKSVERAIEYEIKRQIEILEQNKTWSPETRGWDEKKGVSVLQRQKETAADYRYFPEPDIPPFEPEKIAGKLSLPELPWNKRNRFHQEYGFSYADAAFLSKTHAWADYTENLMSELIDWLYTLPDVKGESDEIKDNYKNKIARTAGGFLTTKLAGELKKQNLSIAEFKTSPENLAELIALVYSNRLNLTNAQKILIEMIESGNDLDPTHIMEEKGYGQITDKNKLSQVADDVISSHPDQVEQYKAGKETVLKFLIGMVMKATEGSADPQTVEAILKDKLR